MSDPPFQVYRNQMSSLSRDIALWRPNPPRDIDNNAFYDHVSIGDVGYLREGTFIRIFNVVLPWDHPSNKRFGDPEHYESLDLGPFGNILKSQFGRVDHYSHSVTPVRNGGNTQVSSPEQAEGVRTDVGIMQAMTPDDTAGFTYQFRGYGALLSLPNGGYREDVIRTKVFENYIRDHIVSWFTWAQRNEMGVERMEDLVLVSGCTWVTSWAAAVSVDNSTEAEISLESRSSGASFVWSKIRGPIVYHNSHFDPQNPPTTPDQCVFIKGFRAKRTFFRTNIRAAAEPLPDDRDNRGDDEIQVTRVSSVPKLCDPLTDVASLNDYETKLYESGRVAISTKCEELRRSLFGIVLAEFVSTRPRFRNLMKKLVTTDEVIAASRNISVSPESQRTQSRIFPVTLPWSISQRASRDINIQTATEHSYAKQYVECVFLAMVDSIRLLAHIGYWPELASSDEFTGRSLASWVEVIHKDIIGVWNRFDKDKYLSSGAFRDEISYLVQDLSTSSSSQLNVTPEMGATWLNNRYENNNANICLVVGYIVDLALILCGVFASPGDVSSSKLQSVKNKFAGSGLETNIHAEIRRFIETVPMPHQPTYIWSLSLKGPRQAFDWH